MTTWKAIEAGQVWRDNAGDGFVVLGTDMLLRSEDPPRGVRVVICRDLRTHKAMAFDAAWWLKCLALDEAAEAEHLDLGRARSLLASTELSAEALDEIEGHLKPGGAAEREGLLAFLARGVQRHLRRALREVERLRGQKLEEVDLDRLEMEAATLGGDSAGRPLDAMLKSEMHSLILELWEVLDAVPNLIAEARRRRSEREQFLAAAHQLRFTATRLLGPPDAEVGEVDDPNVMVWVDAQRILGEARRRNGDGGVLAPGADDDRRRSLQERIEQILREAGDRGEPVRSSSTWPAGDREDTDV